MSEKRVSLTMDSFEQRLMVSGLMAFKRVLQWRQQPTQDVEQLLVKVIKAPDIREKLQGHEAR